MPLPLYARQRSGTHCTEGWVGLGVGLNGTTNVAGLEDVTYQINVLKPTIFISMYFIWQIGNELKETLIDIL
jgi:hypothetical protein